MSRRAVPWVLLAATCLASACGTPPDKEIQQAQGAIDTARAAGADRYAPAEFSAALDALKRANEAVADRDYRLALNNALDARERAQAAAKETADHKATARTDADHAIGEVATAIDDARSRLKAAEGGRNPPKNAASIRTEIDTAEAAVQKARAAFGGADYLGAIDAVHGVTARLRAVTADLEPPPTTAPRRRR